jgi:Family of unknown function (DUF5302)
MPEDAKDTAADNAAKADQAADRAAGEAADRATDKTKDSFRAALERKRAQRHPHEAASQSGGKAQHEHGAVGGRRTFRRKSG